MAYINWGHVISWLAQQRLLSRQPLQQQQAAAAAASAIAAIIGLQPRFHWLSAVLKDSIALFLAQAKWT